MKQEISGRIAAVMAALAVYTSGSSANAALFGIVNNDGNGPNIGSQLTFEIAAGTLGGNNSIDFVLRNLGTPDVANPVASTIASVFIYGNNLNLGTFTPWLSDSGAGVSFEADNANTMPNLPGYNILAAFKAQATPPPAHTGIDPGEWLRMHFTSLPPGNPTVSSLNALLASGDLRVGIHVISVGDREVSQTYLTVVPEPSTVIAGALLLLPFAASTIRRLRRSRTN